MPLPRFKNKSFKSIYLTKFFNQKKLNFIFSCLLIIFSLIILKTYKLTFTIPLTFLGLSIICLNKSFLENIPKFLSLIIQNLAFLILFISSFFSFFNIIYFLNRDTDKFEIIKQGSYTISGNFTKGQNVALGYKYNDRIKKLSSRKIRLNKLNKEIIYDVIYKIDKRNNRYTPNSDKYIDKDNAILFLGGSFTFGEGINDNETLSYYLQELTKSSSINAGLHGYGAHQALHIIENEAIFEAKTRGFNVKTIIYRAIPGHIDRTAGLLSWDKYGPCYKLNKKNQITYKGSFADCGVTKDNIFKKSVRGLTRTKEPFTRYIFSKIDNANISPKINQENNYKLYIEVIKKMNFLSSKKGFNFIVLFEDFDTALNVCKIKTDISRRIIDDLQKNKVMTIRTSEIYNREICKKNYLEIPYDKHPTAYANSLLANYLMRFIK